MSELKIFTYQENQVRTIQKDGEPWFVLKDVCRVLDLSTPSRVAERLDDDEKGMSQIHTPGGPQETIIVNESGLYTVILRSDKPEAKPFRRWVTHEVLPSIRRTGTYSIVPVKPTRPPEVSPGGLAKLISVTRRVMLDMGKTPVEVGAMTMSILNTWSIPVPTAFSREIPGQLCLFDHPALEQ